MRYISTKWEFIMVTHIKLNTGGCYWKVCLETTDIFTSTSTPSSPDSRNLSFKHPFIIKMVTMLTAQNLNAYWVTICWHFSHIFLQKIEQRIKKGDHRCLNFSSPTEVFRLHFRCELQVADIKGC